MKNTGFKKYGDKLLFVLALAVLAVVLIRFGLGRTAAPEETPVIVFTQWWDNFFGAEPILDLVREFEEAHEDIKIVLNPVSYEDFYKGLFDADGEAAILGDVITLDTLWIPDIKKKKNMEFEWPEASQHQNLNAPLISFINVFYYNVDILRKAGFSRPPKTRGEFLNFARAVTSGEEGRWALSMGRNCSRGIYDDIFPWIWAAGAELTRDGRPALNSRPVVESLSFLASLESGGLIVPGWSSADTEKKLDDFVSGRAAFMIAPAKDIQFVRERMGDEAFSVTTIPVPDNYAGRTFHASVGWTLGINSETAYMEEAWLFADFIAGKAGALSEKLIPGNQDPFYSKVWDIDIASENTNDFSGLPWRQLEEIFSEGLSGLFSGQSSPAETARAIQRRWEEAISEQ